MRKKFFVVSVASLALGLISVIAMWKYGLLYYRLSDAKISYNAAISAESEIYYSGNGDYLIFLNAVSSNMSSYAVTGEGKGVGVPVRPIPSIFSKSVKAGGLILCLHCETVSAGSSKLDSNAKVVTTRDGISFSVDSDTVEVLF